MSVLPVELQGVAADRVGGDRPGGWRVHGQNRCWLSHRLAGFTAFFFPLFVTGGTGAGIAQPGKAPGAAMSVLPVNLQALALRDQNAHLLRSEGDAGQRAVAARFTRRVLLIDKANAFVTHSLSLPRRAVRSSQWGS